MDNTLPDEPSDASPDALRQRRARRFGRSFPDPILCVPEDSVEECRALRRRLWEHLLPDGELEEQLVNHIAASFWRLTRLLGFETLVYSQLCWDWPVADALQADLAWQLRRACAAEPPDTESLRRLAETVAAAFDDDRAVVDQLRRQLQTGVLPPGVEADLRRVSLCEARLVLQLRRLLQMFDDCRTARDGGTNRNSAPTKPAPHRSQSRNDPPEA